MKESVAGIALRQGDFGQVLIARRKTEGEMNGFWEFPGGKVEAGETQIAAVKREFLEELGVRDLQVGDLLATSSFTHKGEERKLYAYQVILTDAECASLILSEHSEWRWARLNELAALDFTPSDLKLVPAIIAKVSGLP
jgi:mutator protein MutT